MVDETLFVDMMCAKIAVLVLAPKIFSISYIVVFAVREIGKHGTYFISYLPYELRSVRSFDRLLREIGFQTIYASV